MLPSKPAPTGVAEPTLALAQFASALAYDDLPVAVTRQAKLSFLNFLACVFSGLDDPLVGAATRAARVYAGQGRGTVIGASEPADPVTAAFLNCLSSTVLAFDETFARTVVHPIGPVAAAAMAVCEARRLGGRELLAALVAGTELVCRASLAISLEPSKGAVGWSQTGVCGGLGVATAVAKLMGLDVSRLARAMAFGANAGGGLRAMNGTMSATLAAANASANGLRSAVLAEAGADGPANILEHPFGFVPLFGDASGTRHLTEALGSRYAMAEINFKPYPCGIVAHAAIDAARQLQTGGNFAPEEIEEVTVTVPTACLSLGDRSVVTTASEASVSIQFWVASALLTDSLGPERLSEAWLNSPVRKDLQERVRLVADDGLARSAARASMRLRSGRVETAEVRDATGTQENPMSAAEVERKFINCSSGILSPSAADNIMRLCQDLDEVIDVSYLTKAINTQSAQNTHAI